MNSRSLSGFTLLELLVVLAIVILIVSLAMPAYTRSLARARFKSGVVQFQTELLQTRLLAMKTGTAYVLRYLPNSSFYEVLSKSDYQKRLDEQTENAASSAGLFSSNAGNSCQRQLEGNVLFKQGLVSGTASELSKKDESSGLLGESAETGSSFIGSLSELPGQRKENDGWSEPILFYPNGRTSQAVFLLECPGEWIWYSEIVLRGMTGTARISAISVYPPGSPEFPSALTEEQLVRLRAVNSETDPTAPSEEIPFQEESGLWDENGFPSADSL